MAQPARRTRNSPASVGPTVRNALRTLPDGTLSTPRTATATSRSGRAAMRPAFPGYGRTSVGRRPSSIVYAPADYAELERSCESHDCQQDHGCGCRGCGAPEAETGLVDVIQQQRGGVIGSA